MLGLCGRSDISPYDAPQPYMTDRSNVVGSRKANADHVCAQRSFSEAGQKKLFKARGQQWLPFTESFSV